MSGILYIVGTPIGNLADITLRAIDTLKNVDIIACEDTRHSMVLLNKHEIRKPTMSYYMHRERESGQRIVEMLEQGKSVALITDAGMPCISDPGAILVTMAREAGHKVTVVPGASAVVSAMALTGITRRGFCFLGFLPEKKKERVGLLTPYTNIDIQLVFYCSPHDINDDLASLFDILGERKVYIVKEITKMFECIEIGELSTLRVTQPRGEYVVIVEGVEQQCLLNDMSIPQHIDHYIEQGMDKKTAIKQTAKDRGIPKDLVYKTTIND